MGSAAPFSMDAMAWPPGKTLSSYSRTVGRPPEILGGHEPESPGLTEHQPTLPWSHGKRQSHRGRPTGSV